MRKDKIQRHNGRPLSDEQVAIATVIAEAISSYSEEAYFAGWYTNIEHELWERLFARELDSYELSVRKLYEMAGKEHDKRAPQQEFVSGLKVLAERFSIWVYYGDGETAIHLEDWKPIHETWYRERLALRESLEDVWKRIHRQLPKLEEAIEIPPMPQL